MSFDGSVLYKNEEGSRLRYLSLCMGGAPMKTLSDGRKDMHGKESKRQGGGATERTIVDGSSPSP